MNSTRAENQEHEEPRWRTYCRMLRLFYARILGTPERKECACKVLLNVNIEFRIVSTDQNNN